MESFDGNRMDLLLLQFEMQSIKITAAGMFDISFGLLSAVCIENVSFYLGIVHRNELFHWEVLGCHLNLKKLF